MKKAVWQAFGSVAAGAQAATAAESSAWSGMICAVKRTRTGFGPSRWARLLTADQPLEEMKRTGEVVRHSESQPKSPSHLNN